MKAIINFTGVNKGAILITIDNILIPTTIKT